MKTEKPKIPTWCTIKDKAMTDRVVNWLNEKGYIVKVFEVVMNNKLHFNIRAR